MDPLRFPAGCRTRRLNQASSFFIYILACFIVLLFIRAPFYIVSFRWYVFCLLVVLVMVQYLPSDWLERLL